MRLDSVLSVIFLSCAVCLSAFASEPTEGTAADLELFFSAKGADRDHHDRDYYRLDQPLGFASGEMAHVRIYFDYACGPCKIFHQKLLAWQESGALSLATIEFVPVIFQQEQVNLARAFFAIALLDFPASVHGQLHEAATDGRLGDSHIQRIGQWYLDHGVAPERLKQAFNSPQMRTRLETLAAEQKKHFPRSVPWVVVNDQFVVRPKIIFDQEKTLETINWLLAKRPLESPGTP